MKGLLVILLLCALTVTKAQLAVGDQAPKFILTGHDGELVSIGGIDSKVILLDFWASWCGPCIKSVKTTLKPLYDSYDRSEVEIIGISNDKQEAKWRSAIEKLEMNWPNIWDSDRSLIRTYKIPAIPTYYILDRNGKILASNVYSSDLKKEVKKALKIVDQ